MESVVLLLHDVLHPPPSPAACPACHYVAHPRQVPLALLLSQWVSLSSLWSLSATLLKSTPQVLLGHYESP